MAAQEDALKARAPSGLPGLALFRSAPSLLLCQESQRLPCLCPWGANRLPFLFCQVGSTDLVYTYVYGKDVGGVTYQAGAGCRSCWVLGAELPSAGCCSAGQGWGGRLARPSGLVHRAHCALSTAHSHGAPCDSLSQSPIIHHVLLKDLTPKAKYYYSVGKCTFKGQSSG